MGTRLGRPGARPSTCSDTRCGPPGRAHIQTRWSSVSQSSDLLPIWGLCRRRIHLTPNTRRCVMNLSARYALCARSSSAPNRRTEGGRNSALSYSAMYSHGSAVDARRQIVKYENAATLPSGSGALPRMIPIVTPRSPLDAISDLSGAHDTGLGPGTASASIDRPMASRSEEHTSELQSREKLVCRLLLEK